MYKEIITKSMKDVLENYQAILKAIIIPVILLFLIEFVSKQFTSANEFGVLKVVLIILSLLVDMIILISIHRILILGADSVPLWGIKNYSQREYKFLLKYVGFIFLLVGVMLLSIILSQILPALFVVLLASIFITILVSRISLVFPSLAIDEDMTFIESWRYTKNYKLLAFSTIILFPIGFMLIVGGIYTLVIGFLTATISSHLSVLFVLLNVAVTVFLVSALSNTYMYIIYHTEKGIYDENQSDELDD